MTSPSSPPPRWKIWAAAAALFLAGLGAGALLTGAFIGIAVRKTLAASASGQGALVDRGVERLHDRLVKDLKLAPEQAADIRLSLEASAARLKEVRDETREEIRRIARDGILDIARRLPPAQRAEFHRRTREKLDRLGLPADLETTSEE